MCATAPRTAGEARAVSRSATIFTHRDPGYHRRPVIAMHVPKQLQIQAKPKTPTYVLALTTILICLPILALSQFIAHARVDEFDAWLFACYGRELLGGATLYADVWDNKPPGIFWINALGLWLSGGSLTGIWALCGLAVLATAIVYFFACRRLYGGSTAWIATVPACLYLNVWHYHVGCNRPETFLVLTELACVWLYCRAVTGSRHQRAMMLLAGVCGGLGLCMKQSALAASAAVGAHLVYLAIRGKVPWRDAIYRAGLFATGWCAAVVASSAGVLATSDAHWAWDAVVAFNAAYFAPGAGASLMPPVAWMEDHLRAMGLPLILAAATLLQPLLRRWLGGAADDGPDDPDARRPDGLLVLLWTWLIAAVYFAAMGPHQRPPYLAVALPPLVLLMGHGVYLLLRSGRSITKTSPSYHVVVGVLWFLFMLHWPAWMQVDMAARQYYHRFLAAPDPGDMARLAAIKRHSGPNDAMFAFGYAPEMYWRAKRKPAIRYIGTEKVEQLGSFGQPLLDDIVVLLKEAKPAIILYNELGFANVAKARHWDISALSSWIHAHYGPAPDEDASDVWLRRNDGATQ
jgi:hypothetical protein